MKKGFTLAEVMAVIVIMASLALIIIPIVDKQIKDGKKKAYDDQITIIKNALELYMENLELKENDMMQITLYQLKYSGFIANDIANPITGENFPNDAIITISNIDGNYNYDINMEAGTNTKKYDSLPKLVLNGDPIIYIDYGNIYEELGATGMFNYNNIDVAIESDVQENIGTYHVIYTVSYEGITNKAIRTVIVKDNKGPELYFSPLNLTLAQAKNYDYKSDISSYDVSGVKDISVETNFGALTGTYSVKYIATDNYGNKTIKYRKVVTR